LPVTSGLRTYFEYDDFNQLLLTRDYNQDILTRQRYKYFSEASSMGVDFSSKYHSAKRATPFTSLIVDLVGQDHYTWDFGDGTIQETDAQTIDHTYAAPGDYKVTLIKTNVEHGELSKTKTVTIGVPFDGSISGSGYVGTCQGPEVQYTMTITGGCPGQMTYSWYYKDPTSQGWTSIVGGATVNLSIFSWMPTGQHYLKCVVTDSCVGTVEVTKSVFIYSCN
jgi:PKD repeat protein